MQDHCGLPSDAVLSRMLCPQRGRRQGSWPSCHLAHVTIGRSGPKCVWELHRRIPSLGQSVRKLAPERRARPLWSADLTLSHPAWFSGHGGLVARDHGRSTNAHRSPLGGAFVSVWYTEHRPCSYVSQMWLLSLGALRRIEYYARCGIAVATQGSTVHWTSARRWPVTPCRHDQSCQMWPSPKAPCGAPR